MWGHRAKENLAKTVTTVTGYSVIAVSVCYTLVSLVQEESKDRQLYETVNALNFTWFLLDYKEVKCLYT